MMNYRSYIRSYIRSITSAFACTLLLAALAYAQPVPSLSKMLDELFARGYREQTGGQYDAAIATYTGYLKARPKDAKAWLNRGLAYYAKAQAAPTRQLYESSISDLSEAIKLEPSSEGALLTRGQVYLALRVTDPLRISRLVIADMTEVIRLNPKAHAAFLGRGEAYWELNDPRKAEADLTEAIRLKPNDGYAYFRRGSVRWSTNPEGAKSDFRNAINIDPADYLAKRSLDTLTAQTGTEPAPANPSSAPVAANPPARVAATTVPPNNRASGSHEALSAEATKLLDSGQPDRALMVLQQAFDAVVIGEADTFSKLQTVREQSLIKEKMARAYLMKKDYARSLDTYSNAQMDFFKALNEDLEALNIEMKRLASTGVNRVLYEARIPTALDLYEIGKRGLAAFDGLVLPENLRMKPLLIAVAKLGAGETVASMLATVAKAKLVLAQGCRADRSVCSYATSNTDPDALGAAALADINKAINIAPAIKSHYVVRANVHRFRGDAAAAASDDVRSTQK